jgi:hypothetical protein|tara:strand:+ start:14863 stop:16881 length:2019 start_codon:yes stop_codon:yes gene_type:complete
METCNKYDIMSGRRNSKAPKGASRTSTGSIFDNVYLDEAKRTETNQYLKNIDNENNIGFRNDRGLIHPGQSLNNGQPFERPSSTRETNIRDTQQSISLTGEPIDPNNFKHNNMTPFFGGNVRQNIDAERSSSILETFTGIPTNHIKKEEVSNMFELQRENIYGTPDVTDDFENRYNPSRFRQGVPLNDPVQVGPGLNSGYTNKPSGGFQQVDTRNYVMPKSTNELRSKTNPKRSYGGRILPGFLGSKRGIQPVVEQNKVIRFHSFDTPRFNTTVVTSGPTLHGKFDARNTNRQETLSGYSGNAGPSVVKKPEKYSNYAPEVVHKQNLPSSGPRNATNSTSKNPTIQYCSELKPTQKGTSSDYVGLAATVVKRMIAPVQDIMRATVKETTEDNGRTEGYVGVAVKKGTMYDTDDITRTTIKETTIHDTREGNIGKLGYQGQTYQMDDPKTTARETLKQMISGGNLTGNTRIVRPDLQATTTVKETTLHQPAQGHASIGQVGQGYITNPKEAPPTARQFLADTEYTGVADGEDKGGYTVSKVKAPTTSRQFLADTEYTGVAEGDTKPMSYTDIYNATLNEVKENIAEGREPTQTSVKVASGQTEIGDVATRVPLQEPDALQKTRLVNIPLEPSTESVTTDKNNVCNENLQTRLEPEQLTAFKENPFTHSLNSSA